MPKGAGASEKCVTIISFAGDDKTAEMPTLQSVASKSSSHDKLALEKVQITDTVLNVASDLTESIATPHLSTKRGIQDDANANNCIHEHEPAPMTQIDFVPDHTLDDTLTIGKEFVDDDLSYDDNIRGWGCRSPLACGAGELVDAIGVEAKSAAAVVYSGVKNASLPAVRRLFGACGGVDCFKRSDSSKAEKSVRTAQETLDEATQLKCIGEGIPGALVQPPEKEMSIVQKQEEMKREKEQDVCKKKRYIQRLKTLSMKHL